MWHFALLRYHQSIRDVLPLLVWGWLRTQRKSNLCIFYVSKRWHCFVTSIVCLVSLCVCWGPPVWVLSKLSSLYFFSFILMKWDTTFLRSLRKRNSDMFLLRRSWKHAICQHAKYTSWHHLNEGKIWTYFWQITSWLSSLMADLPASTSSWHASLHLVASCPTAFVSRARSSTLGIEKTSSGLSGLPV